MLIILIFICYVKDLELMLELNFAFENKKSINLRLTNKYISSNIPKDVTRTSPLKGGNAL